MMRALAILLVPFVLVAPATADLTGTTLNLTINHTGVLGEIVGGAYTYGEDATFYDSGHYAIHVSSPAPGMAYDSSLLFNFSDYQYSDFAGQTGTIDLTDIAEYVAPGTGILVVAGQGVGSIIGGGSSIYGTWSVDDVLACGMPYQIAIAWNAVPEPAALSLLTLGALALLRRR